MLFERRERARLDDVVEYLRGIATILMEIDAKPERLFGPNGDESDEEAGS